MPTTRSIADPTFASRFECKYRISPLHAPQVRQFIEPFMRPDPYAAVCPGFRYPICSLYLDTDDLALYGQTVAGEKNRYKLRIRSYSDDPATPIFLEIKRKMNNVVSKRRARLTRAQALALMNGSSYEWLDELPEVDREDALAFDHQCGLVGAKPVCKVKYFREAYESRGSDPLRVTLDTDLMHAVSFDHDFSLSGGRWVATPVEGTILEIKYTDLFPHWIVDLVRFLGLRQGPLPKYILSVDHMLNHSRETALSIAGFTLPPRRI
jgi:hypothetical protein